MEGLTLGAFLSLLKDFGALASLAAVLFMIMAGKLVPQVYYQESQKREELWRVMATRGLKLADRGTQLLEKQTERGESSGI